MNELCPTCHQETVHVHLEPGQTAIVCKNDDCPDNGVVRLWVIEPKPKNKEKK